MADTKITALTAITTVDPAVDVLPIVDVSDTTMAASGTTKKITSNQILGAGGTATLASATITGDLTVDTSTLKVDSANNRVGVGTASPSKPLEVYNTTESTVWANTTTGIALLRAGGTGGDFYFGIDNSTGGGFGQGNYSRLIYSTGAYPIIFSSNASERYRIASDGVATWSNVGGVAGTAMTLNSTGLGVGRSPSYRLQASSGTKTTTASLATVAGITTTDADDFGIYFRLKTDATGANRYAAITSFDNGSGNGARDLVLQDLGGNVGIGVTPSAGGSIYYKTLEIGKAGCGLFTATASLSGSELTYLSGNGVLAYNAGPEWKYGNNGAVAIYGIEDGVHKWYNATTGTAGVVFTPTQAMTLDGSGNLNLGVTSSLINTTRRLSVSGTVAAALQSTGAATVETINVWHTATSGNNIFVDFDTEAAVTSRGSISYNRGGGLVAYNTTSDYRAKDIIGPVSNSGSLIDSLKVYVGKMKGATIERPMLIAHEAQEVAPYAVTGTKDEVDADGKPKYQQMDASALVPLLIAEIQSLRTRVQTLEAK